MSDDIDERKREPMIESCEVDARSARGETLADQECHEIGLCYTARARTCRI